MSSDTRREGETPVTDQLNTVALDLQDERLIREAGVGGAIRAFIQRVRTGDLRPLRVTDQREVEWVRG